MDGFVIVDCLAALLIVISVVIMLVGSPKKAAYLFAAQSLVLVCVFVVLAGAIDAHGLYTWGLSAFICKVCVIPGIILMAYKMMGEPASDAKPAIGAIAAVLLVVVEVAVCFAAVSGVNLPTAIEVKPALAISLANFLVGLTCLVTQRNILKQLLGYCLMENGSHLTLALLAPAASELVELSIALDAIFAVVIMSFLAYQIYKKTQSLDTDNLMELKG